MLGTKSELEKVLAKQRKVSEDKIKKEDKHIEDEFQRILTERAKRLEQVKLFSFFTILCRKRTSNTFLIKVKMIFFSFF